MLDQVERILRTSPPSAYQKGVSAKFQYINDKWGLKFYQEESMRDHTYYLQKLAADHGLAPSIGEKFTFTLPDGEAIYGYITESVEQLGYGYDRNEEYDELIDDLDQIMDTYDMHEKNVGILNGKLVAIDFSECDPL